MYSLRQIIQETRKPSDSWWSIVFINPLSYVFIYIFANYVRVRHELVTFFSLFLGLLAAYFYFLGSYQNLVFAALLFLLSVILDSVDGKLAKLTHTQSSFGRILDIIRDKLVQITCVAGLTLGQFRTSSDSGFLTLGILYLVLSFLNFAISSYFAKGWSSSKALENFAHIQIFGQRAYPIPTVAEWAFLLFVFCPLVGNVKLGLYAALALVIFSVLFLGKQFLNIKRSVRSSM